MPARSSSRVAAASPGTSYGRSSLAGRRPMASSRAIACAGAYARLPERDRDAIVRWAEIRRRIALTHAVDYDDANLADPLLPSRALREHVVAGERLAAGGAPVADDGASDLVALVGRIRRT